MRVMKTLGAVSLLFLGTCAMEEKTSNTKLLDQFWAEATCAVKENNEEKAPEVKRHRVTPDCGGNPLDMPQQKEDKLDVMCRDVKDLINKTIDWAEKIAIFCELWESHFKQKMPAQFLNKVVSIQNNARSAENALESLENIRDLPSRSRPGTYLAMKQSKHLDSLSKYCKNVERIAKKNIPHGELEAIKWDYNIYHRKTIPELNDSATNNFNKVKEYIRKAESDLKEKTPSETEKNILKQLRDLGTNAESALNRFHKSIKKKDRDTMNRHLHTIHRNNRCAKLVFEVLPILSWRQGIKIGMTVKVRHLGSHDFSGKIGEVTGKSRKPGKWHVRFGNNEERKVSKDNLVPASAEEVKQFLEKARAAREAEMRGRCVRRYSYNSAGSMTPDSCRPGSRRYDAAFTRQRSNTHDWA